MGRDHLTEDFVKRTLFAAGLAAVIALCLTISSSAQEQPKPAEPTPEQPKLAPVPTGEKTAQGLKFTVPYKRGEGSLVFSRQNGYLRVDADVRLLYNAGDGQRSTGSGVALALSVDGNNGRILVSYPSPLWFFAQQPPPFRLEKSYSKTSDPSTIASGNSFAAQSSLNFLDHWTTTFWVQLPRVIIPGNTPDFPADVWRAAFHAGDESMHQTLPEGVHVQNPAQAPERMITFRFSELPEREKLAEDPIAAVNKREESIHKEVTSILQLVMLPRNASQADIDAAFVKVLNACKALSKTYPDLLLARHIAWQFALRMVGKAEVDPIALLKDYVDACPSQWNIQTTYIDSLVNAGRKEDALKRMRELLESGLGKGFPPAEVRLKLDLAPRFVDAGEVETAMSLYESALGSEVLKTDLLMRLRAHAGAANIAAKLGKTELEQKLMEMPQAEPALSFNDVRPLVEYTRMLFRIGYEDYAIRAVRILCKSKWLAGNPGVLAQTQIDCADGPSPKPEDVDGLLDTNYGAPLAYELFEAALNSGAFKDKDMARFGCYVGMARAMEAQGDFKGAIAVYNKLLETEKAKLTAEQAAGVKQLMDFQSKGLAQWEDEQKYLAEDAQKKNPVLTLETTKGTIVVELFEDDAPNTVASIVSLTQKKFYDGLTFHRFVSSFVIQGGDPSGDGTGGAGYALKSEVSRRNHFMGSFAMACSRPRANTEGSQFYICTSNGPNVLNLSGNYVVAGRVVKGLDVAQRLRAGDRMIKVTVDNLRDHEYKPQTLPSGK
jgi:peptidyl-prolyl cis-trans isomerase B (cyclophilin B)